MTSYYFYLENFLINVNKTIKKIVEIKTLFSHFSCYNSSVTNQAKTLETTEYRVFRYHQEYQVEYGDQEAKYSPSLCC